MKKLLSILLTISLLTSCASSGLSTSINTNFTTIPSTKLSIVRIDRPTVDENGEPGSYVCTGFVTNSVKGEAVTAAHCVRVGQPVFVDGEASEVLRESQMFALVKVPTMVKPAVSLAPDLPEPGAKVLSFGYAYGWPILTILERMVSSSYEGDFSLDGPVINGMSGGPIVDTNGTVVGMNQKGNEMLAINCSSKEILEFLGEK